MPSLGTREIDTYRVYLYNSTSTSYDYEIRLVLKPTSTAGSHIVQIIFPETVPDDFVDIGATFTHVKMPVSQFDRMYHLLQTENPAYFQASEEGTSRTVLVTSASEEVGEGPQDSDATP